MQLSLLSVTSRTASIEMVEATGPELERPVSLRLDGEQYGSTAFAVFTLVDLAPGQAHTIQADEGPVLAFRTRKESAALDIRTFGAAGGGADDTQALQAAIAACPRDGCVVVPAGTWESGPLFLKSGITVYLAPGATLRGSSERGRYPILPGRLGGNHFLGSWEGEPEDCFASLLTGIDVEDVAIAGAGVIDGNAAAADWWHDPKVRRQAWRPRTLFFTGCRNLLLQGLTVRNSPSWTVHPLFSTHVRLHGLSIENPPDSPNTDGIDPESCEDVEIIGARISVGDDCVALKSGRLYLGRLLKRPCRNVRIRRCLMERGHGAVVIGSETAGGIRDVAVSHCLFRRTDRGLRIKTRRGRGKDGVVAGIALRDCRMEDVGVPLAVNSFYFCDPDGRSDYVQDRSPLPVDDRTPELRDIVLERICATGVRHAACCVLALPERPLKGLVLRDVGVAMAADAEPVPPEMACHLEPASRAGFILLNVDDPVLERVTGDGVDGPLFPAAGGRDP